ncbi:MAG: hypothetical protein J6S14_05050 [Clostridia bacterium]|nr:hypothetical protein [Clostridia bacterium]
MGADLNITEEDLNAVKTEGQAKLDDDAAMWNDRITEGEKIYNDAIKEIGVQDSNGNWTEGSWADKQTDIANENLDYTLDTIEQQREQAKKDYTKEQSGAWVDYQKQINPYGVNAEKMASMGMTGTGYNESSRVSMYNTYQNRVATAREVFARANLDYDNAIREAQLQNNSALAEIAYQAYQDRLELTLEGFQVKNTLLAQKAESQRAIRNEYFNRWKAILDQINTQKALEIQEGIIDKGGDEAKDEENANTLKNNSIADLPIDIKSLFSLGYGTITPEKLAELVESGKVIEYIDSSTMQRKFKKAPPLPLPTLH